MHPGRVCIALIPASRTPTARRAARCCFVNPVLQSSMHLDAGNARFSGAFAGGMRSLRMEAGQLVLFPSWVLHDVKPFEGDGARITVAFNCWFGLKDPGKG